MNFKFCFILSCCWSLNAFSHPYHNDPVPPWVLVSSLEWNPETKIAHYNFTLLHNDFIRSTGRIYEQYSIYDQPYISKNRSKILQEIRRSVSLHSQDRRCQLKYQETIAIVQVPIDPQLRAPAHRIQMKFSCPKAPTHIQNRMVPLALLSSLRIIRLNCTQELLVLDQSGLGALDPHCFDS